MATSSMGGINEKMFEEFITSKAYESSEAAKIFQNRMEDIAAKDLQKAKKADPVRAAIEGELAKLKEEGWS